MNLMTLNQTKMNHSKKFGYLSAVLHLAPALQVGEHNTCPWAGICKAYCLGNAGRLRLDQARGAAYRRTLMWFNSRAEFLALLRADLYALQRRARNQGLIPTMRLNGTSDIRWHAEASDIFTEFPDVQFIDYTKEYARMFESLPKNYHLTYSLNESSPPDAVKKIFRLTRFNVAQVFKGEIPERFGGFPTCSGDDSDLRHLDPRGHVVALKYKPAFSRVSGKMLRTTKTSKFLILN